MATNAGAGDSSQSKKDILRKQAPHHRLTQENRSPRLPHPTITSSPSYSSQSLSHPPKPSLSVTANQPRPRLPHPGMQQRSSPVPSASGGHGRAGKNDYYNGKPLPPRETVDYNENGIATSRRKAPAHMQAARSPPRITPQQTSMARNKHQGMRVSRKPNPWEWTWVNIGNIPSTRCNAIGLHRILFEFGHVSHINCTGPNTANVLFTFYRPALFNSRIISDDRVLFLEASENKIELMPSPADPKKQINQKTSVPVDQIEFGVMTDEHRMMVMHTISSSTRHPAVLLLDLYGDTRHCLDFRFFLTSEPEAPWYRAELRLSSPLEIKQTQHDDGHKELIITSQFPPKWWQSVGRDLLMEIHDKSRDRHKYNEWPFGWRRVTDIDLNPQERDLNPVSFLPPSPVIDTGRWLTWKLKFPAHMDEVAYNTIIEVVEGHNSIVRKQNAADFVTVPREDPVVWDLLDPHRASHESDLHEMQDEMMHLGQDIRYQLEVCISNNNIVENTLTRQFLFELSALDRDFVRDFNNPSFISPALTLLENVADSKRTFFNPMNIFNTAELRRPRKRRLPKGCVLMRTAVITPTTFYVKTPSVEVSNRVIRDNFFAVGNFLRVKFEDEDTFGGLSPIAYYDNQHEVWARIERCFRHGIDIAGRHYDWLACGNSQFRERGAYFFTPYSEEKTARNIRTALGDFSSINIVAKCMARIGQCFSTTRASTNIGTVEQRSIKDIERNGYCFTDGVGKVSPFVAQMVANELYTRCGPQDYPSAFQFRLGGFKGILVVDPALKGKRVLLRPSQCKFDAPAVGLEIIKPSKFSSSTLNQQIILVLTGLGVPKQVFLDKMTKELQDIDLAMSDETKALKMLQKNIDFNQVTLTMAGMILDGFMHSDEPMCQVLLKLWRTWNLKYLKEKAKLFIEKGAFVLGCVDETNTLRMDPGELPEIFIQVPGENESEWKTAEGVCLLARNPSLHPGDIRVVRAVQCHALKHLKNVVVLPQQGERPLANMCSGGDLDGDDYLVMWDDDLLPPKSQWDHPAMNYDAPTPVMCAGAVQDEQFVKFFVDYIKNDNLGQIATNHRATADREAANGGVKEEKCLALAQLHSQAVDFNKTGVPAIMDRILWPQRYPHWIPGKALKRQYHSYGVLGGLYDQVVPEKFVPDYDKPFDSRVLNAYVLTEDMLQKAKEFKVGYDQQMRRVMAQHSIQTEFEVFTAFVMDHNREKHWYSLAEDLGNLMSSIKADYQAQVREHLGLIDSGYMVSEKAFDILGPFVAAMYTVTAQEVAQWKNGRLVSVDGDTSNAPFITYPWLFSKEMGMIAVKKSGPSSLRAMFAPNGEIRQRAPLMKTNYKTELSGIRLEPLAEWKPEHGMGVGDHVGTTAFDIAAVEDSDEITDASVGANDDCPASTRSNSALESYSEESSEEITIDADVEEVCDDDDNSSSDQSHDMMAEQVEEAGSDEAGTEEAGAEEAEAEVEIETAYDRLMAMMA